MSKIVTVHPHTGHSWYDSDGKLAWDEAPLPFAADVTAGSELSSGQPIKALSGHLITIGHPMLAAKILISPRHTVWNGHVNLSVECIGGRTLRGVGTMELASFS